MSVNSAVNVVSVRSAVKSFCLQQVGRTFLTFRNTNSQVIEREFGNVLSINCVVLLTTGP